jgi:hypothetical protein
MRVVPLTSSTATVDGFTPGVYTLTYDYTDDAGNSSTQVTVTVNVVDSTPITVPMRVLMRHGVRRGRRRPGSGVVLLGSSTVHTLTYDYTAMRGRRPR